MPIKARPFKTKIGDVDVEGFFDESEFVFRFYGLVTFRSQMVSIGEDQFGRYTMLEETELSNPDGFVFRVEIGVDEMLESEWSYVVTLRRDDIGDRALVEAMLQQRGIDPDSAILVIPPRQLTSVSFNPSGEIDGSAPMGGGETTDRVRGNEAEVIQSRVRASASQRILYLPHAIEAYLDDPRGASCLLFGYGSENRPVHVVCSPKDDFLAIITAYLPSPPEWSDDFKVRITR